MKNWSKKLLALVCALALTLAMAGCGAAESEAPAPESESAAPAESEAEVVETKVFDLMAFEGGYAGFWQGFTDKFAQAHPEYEIKTEITPKLNDILRTRFLSGDVPDFVDTNCTPEGDPRIMAKDGQLTDLTALLDEITYKDTKLGDAIVPGILKSCKVDDKLMFLPDTMSFNGMFYNAKMLKDLNAEVPTTWDEMLALGETIKNSGRDDISLFTYAGTVPGYFFDMSLVPSIACASGEEGLNKLATFEADAWLNDPVIKDSYNYLYEMAEKGYLMPGTVAMNHTQSQQEFLTGHAAFLPCGNWLENEMKDTELENFEWGFLPSIKPSADDKSVVMGGIGVMFIPAGAKNPEAAKQYLEMYFTPETAVEMVSKGGGILPMNGITDDISEYLVESVKVILDSVEAAGAEYTFFLPDVSFNEVKDVAQTEITSVASLQHTAEEAVEIINAKNNEMAK